VRTDRRYGCIDRRHDAERLAARIVRSRLATGFATGTDMQDDQANGTNDAVDHVLKLAAELEAHGDVHTGAGEIERLRAVLHAWIDSATGFVVTPAFGRVTVLHGEGRRPSTIASADLPYAMSLPVAPYKDA
jgi:hypothetical protein